MRHDEALIDFELRFLQDFVLKQRFVSLLPGLMGGRIVGSS